MKYQRVRKLPVYFNIKKRIGWDVDEKIQIGHHSGNGSNKCSGPYLLLIRKRLGSRCSYQAVCEWVHLSIVKL